MKNRMIRFLKRTLWIFLVIILGTLVFVTLAFGVTLLENGNWLGLIMLPIIAIIISGIISIAEWVS